MTAEERKAHQKHIKETVRNNLILLLDGKTNGKKTIAELCGVKASSVSRWVSMNPKTLQVPGPEHLKVISQHFHVSVDWLLSDHTEYDVLNRVSTYADAIISLIPLLKNGTLDKSNVKDPILQFLCEDYQNTFIDYMPETERSKWISDVMEHFNVPLPRPGNMNPAIIEFIMHDSTIEHFRSKFEEYANIARIVGDPSKMNYYREAPLESPLEPDKI